jgi:hypothetical protein
MQQADWKSADEVAEAIMKGEATYQLIVDLWRRVGELEKEVADLQAKSQTSSESTAVESARGGPRRWRSGH